MAKPYIPTFEVVVQRTFDGELEGRRSWRITGMGQEIDKLEDALAYLCDASMSHIPELGKPAATGESK
jgi:hypothetical protein